MESAGWAYKEAPAAAVTELREDGRAAAEGYDCVVLTEVSAQAAAGARLFVDHREWNADLCRPRDLRGEEEVTVRLFDIAVEELHLSIDCQGKVDRHSGLSCATLPTCD